MNFKRTVAILIYTAFVLISVLSILRASEYLNEYGSVSDNLIAGQFSEQVIKEEFAHLQDNQITVDEFFEMLESGPEFALRSFLKKHQVLVVAAGILLTLLMLKLKGKQRVLFMILYLIFIGYMTVAFREVGYSRGRLEVFWSYRQFFTSDRIRLEILNNIWLFVPLGAALYLPGHRFRWLLAVLLSIMIEIIQFETGMGLCEIDDVISNSLGALIGYLGIYGLTNS